MEFIQIVIEIIRTSIIIEESLEIETYRNKSEFFTQRQIAVVIL